MLLKYSWNIISHLFFYAFCNAKQKWKTVTKNKIENIGFDEEDIPLINQDGYYDYRTPETSRIDAETSFTEPATTEATSTLGLRQKLKRDKSFHYTDT